MYVYTCTYNNSPRRTINMKCNAIINGTQCNNTATREVETNVNGMTARKYVPLHLDGQGWTKGIVDLCGTHANKLNGTKDPTLHITTSRIKENNTMSDYCYCTLDANAPTDLSLIQTKECCVNQDFHEGEAVAIIKVDGDTIELFDGDSCPEEKVISSDVKPLTPAQIKLAEIQEKKKTHMQGNKKPYIQAQAPAGGTKISFSSGMSPKEKLAQINAMKARFSR